MENSDNICLHYVLNARFTLWGSIEIYTLRENINSSKLCKNFCNAMIVECYLFPSYIEWVLWKLYLPVEFSASFVQFVHTFLLIILSNNGFLLLLRHHPRILISLYGSHFQPRSVCTCFTFLYIKIFLYYSV